MMGPCCLLLFQFESSTLWPEDLAATRATKAAFYLKFAYGCVCVCVCMCAAVCLL